MKIVCTGIGRGHDQQPDTLRVSFEDALPPHPTVLTLTISVADAGKFLVGATYDLADPVIAAPAPVE